MNSNTSGGQSLGLFRECAKLWSHMAEAEDRGCETRT